VPLVVVSDRPGWRCWRGVGQEPSTFGSHRFHLGLVLTAIGHGWAINSAYVRLAKTGTEKGVEHGV